MTVIRMLLDNGGGDVSENWNWNWNWNVLFHVEKIIEKKTSYA